MEKNSRAKLIRAYENYRKAKKRHNVLDVFRAFMPEIIFRTTKLEGESVTRRMVAALFK